MVSASVASRSSAVAHLVEVGHLQLAAAGARCRAVGSQLAEDELEQRRLAAAVGADQADLVAAQQGGREAVDQRRRSPKRIDTSFSSATILPLRQAGVELQPHLAELIAPRARAARAARSSRATRPTLRVRRASTPLRTHTSSCASSLSARALASASFSSSRALVALVGGEVARVAAQHAAVELDDARGHGVDEGAVVRDQHQRAAPADRAGPAATRWRRGRGGWSARRAAARRAAATSACASATRFLVPPDSVADARRRPGAGAAASRRRAAPRSSRPSASIRVCSASRSSAGCVRLVALAQRARLGHAFGHRRRTRWRRRRTAAPARRRCGAGPAASAAGRRRRFSRPARIFSSDDLPVPLRPISATRSPASSAKPAPSSSGTWP